MVLQKTTSNVGKRDGPQLRAGFNEDDVGDQSRRVSCEVEEADKVRRMISGNTSKHTSGFYSGLSENFIPGQRDISLISTGYYLQAI